MLAVSEALLYAELGTHGRGPWAMRKSFLAGLSPLGRRSYARTMRYAEEIADGLRAADRRRVDHDVTALTGRAKGDTPAGRQFSKALGTLASMTKALRSRPIVIKKAEIPGHGRQVVAKALDALRSGDLNAEERGQLMIKLNALAERVFAKAETAHPAVDRLDALQAKLDAALASGQSGAAEGLIRDALKLIRRGSLTGPEHAHLSLLINELRSKLEAAADGSKQ